MSPCNFTLRAGEQAVVPAYRVLSLSGVETERTTPAPACRGTAWLRLHTERDAALTLTDGRWLDADEQGWVVAAHALCFVGEGDFPRLPRVLRRFVWARSTRVAICEAAGEWRKAAALGAVSWGRVFAFSPGLRVRRQGECWHFSGNGRVWLADEDWRLAFYAARHGVFDAEA